MKEMIKYPKYTIVKTTHGDYIQSPISSQEIFNSATSYQPDKSDIFVATYPKNGTSWMVIFNFFCYFYDITKHVTKIFYLKQL